MATARKAAGGDRVSLRRRDGVVVVLVFFFFQAEDGIRDLTVTGVQTCALPIWFGEIYPLTRTRPSWWDDTGTDHNLTVTWNWTGANEPTQMHGLAGTRVVDKRSEERRVGKECRSRWSPYH